MKIRDYMTYNGEKTKPAINGECFHGESWYTCPWCNQAFEFWDTQFEEGFIKIENGIYRHKNCGKLITVI